MGWGGRVDPGLVLHDWKSISKHTTQKKINTQHTTNHKSRPYKTKGKMSNDNFNFSCGLFIFEQDTPCQCSIYSPYINHYLKQFLRNPSQGQTYGKSIIKLESLYGSNGGIIDQPSLNIVPNCQIIGLLPYFLILYTLWYWYWLSFCSSGTCIINNSGRAISEHQQFFNRWKSGLTLSIILFLE